MKIHSVTFSLLITMLCAGFFSRAADSTAVRKRKSQVYFSFGAGTEPLHGEQTLRKVFDRYRQAYDYNLGGLYNISCGVKINDKWSVGGVASYEHTSGSWLRRYYLPWLPSKPGHNYSDFDFGIFKCEIFTLALETSYNYWKSKNDRIELYMLGSVGTAYRKEQDAYDKEYFHSPFNISTNPLKDNLIFNNNSFRFKFQVTPIAFSFGGKIRFYTELGLGYKGLVNMGIIGRIN